MFHGFLQGSVWREVVEQLLSNHVFRNFVR